MLPRDILRQRDRVEVAPGLLPDGGRDGQAEGHRCGHGEATDQTPQEAVTVRGLEGRGIGGICAHRGGL